MTSDDWPCFNVWLLAVGIIYGAWRASGPSRTVEYAHIITVISKPTSQCLCSKAWEMTYRKKHTTRQLDVDVE